MIYVSEKLYDNRYVITNGVNNVQNVVTREQIERLWYR